MKTLTLGFVLPLFLMISCENRPIDNEVIVQNSGRIAAGYGEKSFVDRYGIKISLPMPEADFLTLVKQLKLHYEPCGGEGNQSIPSPRQATKIDLKEAVRCYEIDGDVDLTRRVGARYRAFVDASGRVIYIENAFSYTGP